MNCKTIHQILKFAITVHLYFSHQCVSSLSNPQKLFRKSTLLSWKEKNVLGYCMEEKDSDNGVMTVTTRINSEDAQNLRANAGSVDGVGIFQKEDIFSLTLPESQSTGGSLASQFWPPALASSILLRSSKFRSWICGKDVVELGCGRGLAGLVAAENAASCLLTDNDEEAINLLSSRIIGSLQRQKQYQEAKITAERIDWRDVGNGEVPTVDLILGTDIAYYYHLLRPFMDTSRAFMSKRKDQMVGVGGQQPNQRSADAEKFSPSTLLVIGQANRESQWDLYKNIKNGCYNQFTDEHEPPWPGTVHMLLYKLQMSFFCENQEACEENIDGLIPISVIIYHDADPSHANDDSDDSNLLFSLFGDYAYEATEEDDESIMKSF